MTAMRRCLVALALALPVTCLLVRAQPAPPADGTPKNFGVVDGSVPRDPRSWSSEFPKWGVNGELANDVFTFARLRYNSSPGRRSRSHGKWSTDYPDSDLNFSFRLQQLTSMQVNPNGTVVDIERDQLRHYPFVYMLEAGDIVLSDEEAKILRDYMLNGGFIMVDDFWGTREWENFHHALKQIWPDRDFQEVPLEHEIFQMVFPLKVKPQIPHISYSQMVIQRGITYEFDKPGSEVVHYRAIYDDKKRIVMFICWNTDTGEGWEQEGTDPWYFREFSEKYAYPLGINIVVYALTH